MFFSLFFTLDLAFLFLACEQYANDMGNKSTAIALQKTGGVFGFMAAFLAWYCALAGLQDSRFVYALWTLDPLQTHHQQANCSVSATPSSRSPSSTSHGLTRVVRIAKKAPALRCRLGPTPRSNEE